MKLLFCVAGLAGAALAEKFTEQSAKSFLRVRRDNVDDWFNYREEWEKFKDVLEGKKQFEAEVDILESCISSCRWEDWKLGAGFSEEKKAFDKGKRPEGRPKP